MWGGDLGLIGHALTDMVQSVAPTKPTPLASPAVRAPESGWQVRSRWRLRWQGLSC